MAAARRLRLNILSKSTRSRNGCPTLVSKTTLSHRMRATTSALRAEQYQGQMVADVAPQTQQAWNLAASSGNAGQDQYAGSQAGFLNSMAQKPSNITAAQSPLTTSALTTSGLAPAVQASQAATAAPTSAQQAALSQLSGTNLQPYMNPYTQSVINATLPIMQQANALNQNQIQNQANSANAFGGSRQGIQQGVPSAGRAPEHRPDGRPTQSGQFPASAAGGRV